MGINDSILSFVDGRVGPAGRYIAVSGFNYIGHQLIVYVANSLWGWEAWQANILAALSMLMPAYFLTRSWVWSVDGVISVREEVLPFFALAALGLLVSTGTAQAAQKLFGSGLMVNLGSTAGYVIVWIAKFFILERIFNRDRSPGPAAQREVVEVG